MKKRVGQTRECACARAMPSRGFTTNSLVAGGRWGRPARTGIEFNDAGNAIFKKEERDYVASNKDSAEIQNTKPLIYYPGVNDDPLTPRSFLSVNQDYNTKPGSDLVHDANYIGAKMGEAAQRFEKEITDALDRYILNLQKAYTYEYRSGDNGVVQTFRALDLFSPGEIQPIVRQYLTVKKAARELIDVRTDQASIEAPFKRLSVEFNEGGSGDWGDGNCFPRSATRAFLCCTVFSILLGVGALAVAGIYYAWGGSNYGVKPTPIFWDGNFWGWPSEKVFRNIWCGLMLGIVFGFLDNFGLFYGTSALDSTFYSIGNKLASGLLADTEASSLGQNYAVQKTMPDKDKLREVALTAHSMTEDMMSGLGNTFSGAAHAILYRCIAPVAHTRDCVLACADLLGVALGTAALEIAKAGLGVEPSWWPADLLAIVLGCLLGVFLPVLVKYKDQVASGGLTFKYIGALTAIFFVFLSVLIVGLPFDREANVPWTIWVSLVLIVLVLIFLIVVILIIPLVNARPLVLKQQWSVLETLMEFRNMTWYDKHAIRDRISSDAVNKAQPKQRTRWPRVEPAEQQALLRSSI